MNSDIVVLALFGFISMALDGLLWGMMGYVVFKALSVKDRYWVMGALVSGLIYFMWDELIMGQMMGKLGMQIDNEAVMDFVGDDIFAIEASDLAFALVVVFIGFKVSQRIVQGIIRKVLPENNKEEAVGTDRREVSDLL
ncbi:hypothetical protein E9993_17310 [Labilibacter sediminis]|nr:hypothetical protein E9993_17310 [Labilibacter sediminis]